MPKWLFGSRAGEAARGEDSVWMTQAARLKGVSRDAHIGFHLSLEDPLLQSFAGSLKPLLEKLGMREDEPIAHAMVTRAIRNAQERSGG